jgi:hypothetical protein
LANIFVSLERLNTISTTPYRTEVPDPEWFDETQAAVYDKLQSDEKFLDSFRQSIGYVRLLAELDLLKVSPGNSC